MQKIVVDYNNLVKVEDFGGKAFWLSWLKSQGYNVPYALFISAFSKHDIENSIAELFSNDSFLAKLDEFKIENGHYAVALRSSGTLEDAKDESLAGHFKSVIGVVTLDELRNNLHKVVESLNDVNISAYQKMGVVIQKMITPSMSGVAFSSNPITGLKKEIIISVIEGFGDDLVSGRKAGEDILIINDGHKTTISPYKTKITRTYLLELKKISKEIEKKLNHPVDLEWCIDQFTNKLQILQCRPITGYNFEYVGTLPILLSNKNKIPQSIQRNDKIALRFLAEQNNIKISNANLVILNCTESKILIDLATVGLDEHCKGYSVVLLHPNRIAGNIIRHFAKKEIDKQKSFFRTCQRYKIRRYAELADLETIIQSIANKCFEFSWNCILIIQEIYEPEYTGIVKKIDDGYIVELARGHFVPKGIVTTSQYVLDSKRMLLHSSEATQKLSYRIVDGKVLEQEINEKIIVSSDILISIIDSLTPVLKDQDKAVEFGVIKTKNNCAVPYLIDLVEDKSQSNLSTSLIAEGVISTGSIEGEITIIANDVVPKDSLHLHFHNSVQNEIQISKNIIFVCPSPDIAFLSLLEKYDNSKIGFIFREGSSLSHFSIILRERGIPAIVVNENPTVTEGTLATVDAISGGLKPIERLKFTKI